MYRLIIARWLRPTVDVAAGDETTQGWDADDRNVLHLLNFRLSEKGIRNTPLRALAKNILANAKPLPNRQSFVSKAKRLICRISLNSFRPSRRICSEYAIRLRAVLRGTNDQSN